jgi:hypothetical protein
MNATTAAEAVKLPWEAMAEEGSVREQTVATARNDAEQSYATLRQTIKDLLEIAIPQESTVLVVAKGDDDLVDLPRQRAWHFPRAINGKFAGCYPANSEEAIRHLEQLRYLGAEYLVIPRTSFWWLEFYQDFTRHLQQRYRIVTYQENVCVVYGLLKSS